ncbi:MAG: RepB family plasmid replication initiator protein, partial [Verrucomicrobiaceae bacterium]
HARRHLGSFFITVEELRDWLHIEPGELTTAFNLHSRAIDYPQQQLDEKSPLTFTAAARKDGRKICGWTITIIENKPKPPRSKAKKPRRRQDAPAVSMAAGPVDKAIMDDLRDFKASLAPGLPLPVTP